MRVGFRTLFPESPPENDRWSIEIVPHRSIHVRRLVQWIGYLVVAALLGVRVLLPTPRYPDLWMRLSLTVATLLACFVVLGPMVARRRGTRSAIERRSNRYLGRGLATDHVRSELKATDYQDLPMKCSPIDVLLVLTGQRVVEVWLDAPRVGSTRIDLPPKMTGVIRCDRRGHVVGVTLRSGSGYGAPVKLNGRGSLPEPDSSDDFEARVASLIDDVARSRSGDARTCD